MYCEKEIREMIPSSYSVESIESLASAGGVGVILRHSKSGARVAAVINDDENKLFCAGFRTPPVDNCGTPHIIEHSVLCGSERYPLKDPFMQLLKGSMQTFLNAMTYPDKTMYPVSSCNDSDFKNLMNIYLDAVFAPAIGKHPEILMQEGWHYEPTENGGIEIGGVVYSEMKGATSSPDSNIFIELMRALYPDTPYGKSSGGDPEDIPELTQENFLDFYRKHYHPSNAYMMLYGNMDIRERLEYMEREYLSKYDATDLGTEIPCQEPFGESIKETIITYPVGADETEEGKTYLACGITCGDYDDAVECIAYGFLYDILVETPGAPIKTALTDAGIGKEIFGSFEFLKQPFFTVIAKHTDPDKAHEFIEIIERELKRAAAEGINKKSLISAIERSEFRLKEGEQSTYSKGLNLILEMMNSWLYSDADPFAYIRHGDIYKKMRELADTDYYEKLIEKLLASNHKVLLTMRPESGKNERLESELAVKLKAMRENMSDEEYSVLCDSYRAFTEYQDREETEEELKCIPLLSRSDIGTVPQPIYNRICHMGGVKTVIHDIETNGIAYVRLMFDVSHIPAEELTYLDILSNLYGKVDTDRRSYSELLDDIRMTTGGLSFACAVYRKYGSAEDYTLNFEINMRVMMDKLSHGIEIVSEIINGSKLDDTKRLYEILCELVSEKQRDILYAGSEYASSRALAYFSPAEAAEDLIDGISSYEKQKQMSSDFEQVKSETVSALASVAKKIFNRSTCTVSIAADADAVEAVGRAVMRLTSELPKLGIPEKVKLSPLGKLNEGIMTSSKVQYVALCGNLFKKGYSYNGAYSVLAAAVKNDYLYPEIRMKGGAYGYSCVISQYSGDIVFSTYRDPCLEESVETIKSVGDFIRSFDLDEDGITRLLIGIFGRIDRPLTPYMKAVRSLGAYMTGTTYEDMCKTRSEMLSVTSENIRALAETVDDAVNENCLCVIGSEEKIRSAGALFENTVRFE